MPRLLSSVVMSAVFVPALAFAGNGDLTSGSEDPLIWGGNSVETCGWPTTVRVDSLPTATELSAPSLAGASLLAVSLFSLICFRPLAVR